ncbi:MAG: DUF1858 domain-containing protein [Candidatus Heimdallarchaeota archaeon]|nr:DUF1858 domain-containing protein [Candidatus Heimdallarchaeota archaeon]
MEITKDTKVSAILKEYGDIAEVFGVKNIGKYSIRRVLTKLITVERAAKVHKIPLDEFMVKLNSALELKTKENMTN